MPRDRSKAGGPSGLSSPPGGPPPPPLGFAQARAEWIAAPHAPLLEGLRGYAEAQALSYEDVLCGVCRQSMRLRAAPQAPRYPEGGCSSLAVVGADGHARVGRNCDFHPAQRVRQRLRLAPARGRPSLGTRGSVPGRRYDGVNDAGLFIVIGLHVALSDEPAQPRPGIPFHLLPRLVLETCADTPAATNHYRHPALRRCQHGRRLAHSERRLNFLLGQGARLRAELGEDPAAAMTASLADHLPGVGGHAGGQTTLWSLTADLSARRIAHARSAPCQAAFETAAWPGPGAARV